MPSRDIDDATAEAARWLLVVGQRLLVQLIVSAFGEPGFSRFLEGFAKPGTTPSGPFVDELCPLVDSLARELEARPPAYRVRARSLPHLSSQLNTRGIFDRREKAEALSRPFGQPLFSDSDFLVGDQRVVGLFGPESSGHADGVLNAPFLP